ncbi:hypothetical protein XM53_11740 [Roseovarius atlanticus]|uniref:DUF1127 domain-containing protein n=1 Tax=Roseovarius atlanticus TaxID=1641875 RepID=A0A0T5NTN9_9RHOB|nr:hypothetical protein [Roseovarius atlanticus]KRS12312.1 hypothetical protein XM53_11740 [Roseovarius atlanticus]
MATSTTNLVHGGFFSRFFRGIADGFEQHARIMSRRGLIDELHAKSDAELAEMGIKREDIVRHVFQDLFYS